MILSLAGFVVVLAAMLQYFASIAREKVPVRVGPHSAAFVVGGLLGLLGIVREPGTATVALGGSAIGFGAFLLWLLGQRRTPDGQLLARIGEVLPDLVAPNQSGVPVRIADLRGQRILLKFYRGHW